MEVYNEALKIVKKLNESGHIAYFAGGFVRDHVMENESYDIDIATDATPDRLIELFPKTIPVGAAFGVVVVVSSGHQL